MFLYTKSQKIRRTWWWRTYDWIAEFYIQQTRIGFLFGGILILLGAFYMLWVVYDAAK